MTGRPSTMIPFPGQKYAGNNVKKIPDFTPNISAEETEILDVFLVDSVADKQRVSPIRAILV